ncbi:MAG TPA: tetratricopeptide repeat protein [Prolixibacteraceae bacterium]|nr:tetratricopeptide repeat protein [Prolixibacteraceae bacterium]
MTFELNHTIDEYLLGNLNESQRMDFENEMNQSPQLQDEVHFNQHLMNALLENDIFSLRTSIKNIMDEEETKKEPVASIDSYLLDQLNNDERIDFEKQMKHDGHFRREIGLNREINEAIQEKEVMRLRKLTADIIRSEQDREHSASWFNRKKPLIYIGAAASVTALLASGAHYMFRPHKTAEELFHQMYQPFTEKGFQRSFSQANPVFSGIECYNERKYDAALEQFSRVLTENEYHPMSNFYSGLCYMEKREYEKAGLFFQKVIDEKNNLFIEQAEWYLALSFMADSNEVQALPLLNSIIEKKGYYEKNARDIIKKLK